MPDTYTTQSGDTWDAIAYNVYGSESYVGYLMQNNFPCLDYFLFPSGVVLNTPAQPDSDKISSTLPFWRT